jgi:hypothetical protein
MSSEKLPIHQGHLWTSKPANASSSQGRISKTRQPRPDGGVCPSSWRYAALRWGRSPTSNWCSSDHQPLMPSPQSRSRIPGNPSCPSSKSDHRCLAYFTVVAILYVPHLSQSLLADAAGWCCCTSRPWSKEVARSRLVK